MRTDTPRTIYLKDYKKPDYLAEHVDLTFRIFDDRTIVTSKTTYKRNHQGQKPLQLNGEHQVLKSVTLDGKLLEDGKDFEVGEKTLSLPGPTTDTFTLEIESEINPAANTRLEGLYKSGGNWCTQCEAEGFRTITYFQDRPDVMCTFKVRLEADKEACPVLLSNGNLIEEGDLEDKRHFSLWHDPFPKPCYLFALVAGDLVHIEDTFTTKSGREVLLRIYVREGDQEQCWFAMESLKHSMKWDEDKYGREYELDRFNIVAVSDFNMGAMENTSLNIFNTALVLAHQETATDTDFERVEGVIAHEYFHNWTGNRVTCRDWFQLSLKEGLTVFRDQEFTADMNSRGVKRIDDVQLLRRLQFAEDSGPMAHPIRPDNYIEINNFYTVTVYEKGAEVIRMQHTLLGPETYRKATDLYFERYDGMAVTCDDFVQCMADASDLDLSQFKLWYSQAGTPIIDAKGKYDEKKRIYTLTLKQTVPDTPGQKDKKPMHIPVQVGLVGPNGDDMANELLELKEGEQSFTFDNIPSKPVPSILRGFSAPVKLSTDLTDDDLRFLMVNDNDGFNQWEAGHTYALRVLEGMIKDGSDVPESFLKAYGDLLDRAMAPDADKALMARTLSIPDVPHVSQRQAVIDPRAIYEAREKVLNAIVDTYADKLEEIYKANRTGEHFSLTPEARGQRVLQNTVMLIGANKRTEKDGERALSHYKSANNMTDRMAALYLACALDGKAHATVVNEFYNKFKHFPLVVDKWFSAQAMVVRPSIHEDIRRLKGHTDFTMTNPNRIRSLYAAFAMSNPVSFHAEDGNGYTFLADAIIELNEKNPQIASRLLTPFREWKRYTPDRQEKMKGELRRISELQDLSPDVFEVVSKSLAA